MKTIRQIASEIGVSKQAVHQKIKREPLSTSLRQFTSTVDGVVYIDVVGENLVKSAFSNQAVNKVDVNEPSIVDGRVDRLIDMLQTELEIKNKQIDELNARLSEAHAIINSEQVLHGGTIQKQLLDGDGHTSNSGDNETDAVSSSADEAKENSKKRGLFGLFKKG